MKVKNIDIDKLSKYYDKFWIFKEFSTGLLLISFILFFLNISLLLFFPKIPASLLVAIMPINFIIFAFFQYITSIEMKKNFTITILSIVALTVFIFTIKDLILLLFFSSPIEIDDNISIELINFIFIFIISYITMLFLAYQILNAFYVIHKSKKLEKFIISEQWKNHIEGDNMFLKSIGFPYSYLNIFSKYQKIGIYFIFIFSSSLFYIALFIIIGFEKLSNLFLFNRINDEYSSISHELISERSNLLILILLVGLISLIISFLLNKYAKNLAKTTVNKLKESDKRKHIVYLRAFEQDKYFLSSKNYIQRFFNFILRRIKLDPIMIDECTVIGPVIALGDPKNKKSPYGPPRYYAKDDEWQNYVKKILNEAKLIYIFLQGTDGVKWELKQLISLNKLLYTIFIVSPKSNIKDVLYYFKLIANSSSMNLNAEDKNIIIDKIENNEVLGFFITNQNEMIILNGNRRDWTAYFITIRASLRLKVETETKKLEDIV